MDRSTRGRCAASMFALALAHAGSTGAQSPPLPAPGTPTCAAAEHRQFDFWLGEWDVTDGSGKHVGQNRIESAQNGCALIEHWTGAGGVTGTSLNVYDRDRAKWHQTWVDNSGGLLQLDGNLAGDAMILTGEAFDAAAPTQSARQRITWTPRADGRVRQLWETSQDGGKTWTVAFDGLYAKKR